MEFASPFTTPREAIAMGKIAKREEIAMGTINGMRSKSFFMRQGWQRLPGVSDV